MYNIGVHIVYVSVAMQIKAGPILFSCWYSGTYGWHWRIFHLPVYSSLSLLPLSPVHRCQLHPDPASCCHHTQICTVQTHFDSLAPCEQSRVLGQTPTPKFFPTYFNKDAKLKSSKYDGKLWITHTQTHKWNTDWNIIYSRENRYCYLLWFGIDSRLPNFFYLCTFYFYYLSIFFLRCY